MSKIKVLVVDDSALVRQLLTRVLEESKELEVVGSAQDPFSARNKIKSLNPDVLTLDLEMPRMDGLTFLSNLMRLRPMPVVMVSSLTEKGADVTLRALELGAVDFVTKPKIDIAHSLADYGDEIRNKVIAASRARVRPLKAAPPAPESVKVTPSHSADAVLSKRSSGHFRTTDRIVAIGASTGGTEAIKDVLMGMPPDGPMVVIAQHIPETFSTAFARRLNGCCAMEVKEAEDGEQLLPGYAYIAPGSHHLMVERSGARYVGCLSSGPPVNRHRPAVDVLFRSVAQNAGPNAVGALLTGMGADGARGLLEMKEAGAQTIAQNEATSVVWGMPGEAVKLGAADVQLPLERIAAKIMALTGASVPRQAG